MKNKKMVYAAVIIVVALAALIVGIIILPDTLVVQVGFSGESGTTMPKLVGLAIPSLVSIGFAVMYAAGKGDDKRNLTVALVGLIIFVLTFAFNI